METTLTFGPGEVRLCVDIVIIDDNIEEGSQPESILVALSAPTGDLSIPPELQILNVNILDSDSKCEEGSGRTDNVCRFAT